ncbi:hypothetical protein LguiA_018225 [Lonicera macranthoides]
MEIQQEQQQMAGESKSVVATGINKDSDLEDQKNNKSGWRKFMSYIGPGFLVSLAYLDPGNLETDLQAGADHKYESLAANLGVSTGKHLSELCRAEYPKYVKYCLWLLAEIAVIAADIPEGTFSLIGTAFALNILLGVPLWGGVLFTGLNTLLLLGLQQYGVRKLELLIAGLVLIMAACFFGELGFVRPPAENVLKGMFIPSLKGHDATGDAIALLGALVMPHNLFLHSALVLSRKIPNSVRGINDACRYFLIESGFALSVAFLINVSVVSVSGTVCSNISKDDTDQCNDLTLNSASFLLKNVLGKSASTVYAIALLASGQSSAISGTYAGQYIMQIIIFSWILGLAIIGINIYYLTTAFISWLIHSKLPKVINVFIGIAVFPLMLAYILTVIYLMFRKDTVVTFKESSKLNQFDQMSQILHMETSHQNSDEGFDLENVVGGNDLLDDIS